MITWSIISVLALVLVFAIILLNRLKVIRRQKQEVDKAYALLDQKNTELTDSINYAQKIQQALLQDEEQKTKSFPEHFILFKPRDMVSGDFYWGAEKGGHVYFAAMDCTGHGVPGAFMSMLGVSFLNDIMKTAEDASSPGRLLDLLKKRIVKELVQQEKGTEVKDGMDGAILRFSKEQIFGNGNNGGPVQVEYAGANNPLYVVRECECQSESESKVKGTSMIKSVGGNTDQEGIEKRTKIKTSEDQKTLLTEIKADPMAIAHEERKTEQSFTTVKLKAYPNDSLYIFSDGFADQFGGEKNKKFRYGNFKKLLMSLNNEPMEERKQFLDQTFTKWKKGYEQVDDVCILGVKV
ncbi:MAG: PP2C family protein-serine/threonine phosphatase [Flavobacteriales bacterium]